MDVANSSSVVVSLYEAGSRGRHYRCSLNFLWDILDIAVAAKSVFWEGIVVVPL